jgi:uncharacterized membrane protein
MKFFSKLKQISILEMIVVAIFIVYLILPIGTPALLAPYIESPLGMIVIFCITVFLFIYSNPILAVLYVFVAYELLRRSTKVIRPNPQSNYVQYTKPEAKKNVEMKEMNKDLPIEQITLEEVVVSQMAPIGKSDNIVFTASTFKPVATNVQGASPI